MKTRWIRVGVVGALAFGTLLAVGPFDAPSGAQSAPPATIPFVGNDAAPALSDDGTIVVFSSTDVQGVSTIVGHDRGTALSTPIPGSAGGQQPAVSGDGCTVAWTVPGVPGDEQIDPDPQPSTTLAPGDGVDPDGDPDADSGADPEVDLAASPLQAPGTPSKLFVADRCADPVVATEAVAQQPVDDFGPPALSQDGAVLVVSSGDSVLRFTRTANGHQQTATVAPEPADPPLVVTPNVDISDDGAVVVFAAGVDPADDDGLSVFRSDRDGAIDTVTVVAAGANQPSVSGSGSIVAFVAVGPEPAIVSVRDGENAPVPIGPGARPQISGDGNHVVYEADGSVLVSSWTGDGVVAFETVDTLTLGETPAPTASGPSISRHATTVATDVVPQDQADADITVSSLVADAGFGADTYQLGTGDIGAELGTTVTFANAGPASLAVATVAVDGTFTLVSENCRPVVRPGATCSLEIGFTVQFLEEVFGVVTLTPDTGAIEPVPYTTEVSAVGQAPPVDPPATTSTTTPRATTGGTTGGTTSGTTTGGRTTTSGSTSTTGGRTTSSTTGGRTTSTTGGTTTTTLPAGSVEFSPITFDFAPTIVADGRRTGLVEIVNTTPNTATVTAVRVEPADGGFDLVETDCAAVPTSGRCNVTIGFSPATEGDLTAQVIATLSDGTEITAALTGIGAPPPSLTVFPGVAATGQVVTVRGAGFPTGSTVELTWSGEVENVVVDETGGFAIPVIVLSHTSRGPQTASVAGQADLFGDVTATMLVTSTANGSSPSVLDGVGPNIGR